MDRTADFITLEVPARVPAPTLFRCEHDRCGVGRDVTIGELASLVADVVGFKARSARKLLDVSRLTALGWQARTALADGIATTYRWVDNELAQGRRPRGFPAEATRSAAYT